MLLGRSPVFAQSVALTWNPSTDTNAVGYKIYYGTASEVYPYTTYVANVLTTNATISGLTGGVTYYFSATTVSANGDESPFSNETTFTPAASTNSTSTTNSTPATVPPTLNSIASMTLNQSAGAQTVSLTGISAGTSGTATITVSAVSSDNGTVITAPTVSYTSPNSTGTLTFTPVAAGTATVTVTVDNGGTSNNPTSEVFTVTVQAFVATTGLPVINPVSNVTVYENSGAQTVPLSGITSGLTGSYQYVSIWAYTSAAGVIPTPTVNYTSPNTTGSLTFTPVPGVTGTATITVTANNGNANFTQIFTVTVAPAPTSVPPTLNAITNQVLYNTAGTQTVNLTGIGAGIGGNSTVTASAVSSDNGTLISAPVVNYTNSSSTGTLTFSPVAGATGTATVTVAVNNGAASNNVAIQTFTATVLAVPPTLNPLANMTLNQAPGVQIVSLTGISPGTTGNATAVVSAVSSDNGTVISPPVVSYTSPNSAGTLSFSVVGTGTATVTVTVANSNAANIATNQTFTVTVTAVPPTLAPIGNVTIYQNAGAQSVNLGGISAGSMGNGTAVVSAVSSDNGTVISTPVVNYASPNSTGSLSFSPVAAGTATVTVTVASGSAASQTFTVTILAVPQTAAPTLAAITNLTVYENAGLQTVNLTGISAGTSGNPTVNVYAVSSDNGTIISAPAVNYTNSSSTGTLTFTPVTGATGTATVTVTVDNGGLTNNPTSQVFTVTVVAGPPTLDPIANVTVSQSAGLQTINLTGITPGTSGNPTVNVYAVSSDNGTVITAPAVNYTAPNSTGTLTFSPVAAGTATVTVTVDNGGTSNNPTSQSFTVTVTPTVQPPTLNAITNLTIYENSGVQTLPLTGITSGVTGAYQTVSVWAYTSDAAVIPAPTVNYTNSSSTGSLTFTPVPGAVGTANVTVTVNNGTYNFSQVFTVTVVPPPVSSQIPTLNAITNVTVTEGASSANLTLTGISSGLPTNITTTATVQGHQITTSSQSSLVRVSAVSSDPRVVEPSIRYASPSSSGVMTLRFGNTSGTAVITVTVSNSSKTNNSTTQSFTVTVVPPAPPTLDTIGNVTVTEDTGLQTIVLTGITPGAIEPGQMLKITASSSNMRIVSSPRVQYTSPATTALLTFTAPAKATGTTVVTVTASNGGRINGSVRQQFTVTVVAPSTNTVTASATMLPLAQPSGVVAQNAAALLTTISEPQGQIGFQVTGTSGGKYAVQTSSDLTHWTSVQTNTVPFVYEDATTGSPQQFYRAVTAQ